MFADPRFWLYLVIFFGSSGLTRALTRMKKDKKGILLKVYPALALASLTVFWVVSPGFSPGTPIITFLFVLTALVPGILTGLNLFLIFLAPLAAGAVIFILDVPPVPLSYRDSEPLATLSFYPTVENQLFFELTEPGSRPHLGRLSGKSLALVVKKENYPDYLFFLKSSWVLIGAVTENLNTADLPAESSDTFLLLSEKAVKADPFLQSGYPALRFLDPGYFNSYSYIIRNNRELVIIESKQHE